MLRRDFQGKNTHQNHRKEFQLLAEIGAVHFKHFNFPALVRTYEIRYTMRQATLETYISFNSS